MDTDDTEYFCSGIFVPEFLFGRAALGSEPGGAVLLHTARFCVRFFVCLQQ